VKRFSIADFRFWIGVPAVFCVALALGLLVSPPAADAQQVPKVPRVGYLGGSPSSPLLEPFRQGLHDLGWIEGQTVAIEYRWTEGRAERLPGLVAELVRLNVDVIYTAGSNEAASVAKQATTTIPIVFTTPTDPLAVGLVPNLARPGGNITGLGGGVQISKRVELLKEAVPKITRLAVLYNPSNPGNVYNLKDVEETTKAFGLKLQLVAAREPADLDKAFSAMSRERANALQVSGDPLFFTHRTRLVGLAARHRLPAIYNRSEYAKLGGLMAISANDIEQERRAAVYIDKILKGTKPGDLPVEQPTRFALVINLKTAKALGLTIPPTLLMRADQVIE
jgi:putative ABC transport system substrate-binding protein